LDVVGMFTIEYSYELELEAIKEEGIEKGSYDTKIETARNCLNLKMLIETISAITGLAREEIAKL